MPGNAGGPLLACADDDEESGGTADDDGNGPALDEATIWPELDEDVPSPGPEDGNTAEDDVPGASELPLPNGNDAGPDDDEETPESPVPGLPDDPRRMLCDALPGSPDDDVSPPSGPVTHAEASTRMATQDVRLNEHMGSIPASATARWDAPPCR